MPRWTFPVSPRFEVCYALALLARPQTRLHAAWRGAALERLGDRFGSQLAALGEVLWIALPEVLGGEAPVEAFESLLRRLRGLDEGSFQRRLLSALLHDQELVADLAAGRVSMPRAAAGAGPLIEAVARAPAQVRDQACDLMEAFWERALGPTWDALAPAYRASAAHAERLFEACGPGELAAAVRRLVEVDEAAGELRAARGGYRIALADLEACYVMPSAFNLRRFWSVAPAEGGGAVAFLPYFDPALELDAAPARAPCPSPSSDLDPALMCKALGDATRFAMLALLAQGPRNGADLAKALGLSKPTISHHVFQLREAGAIEERARGNAVELSVKRQALEALSGALLARLFPVGGTP